MKVDRELVVHPQASLRFLRLSLDEFGGPRHRHHHLELTWIERGAGTRSIGDHVAAFDDGDLVLVGADLPHLWTTRRRPPGAAPRLASVLQFSPALCQSPALPELAPLASLVRRAAPGLAITGRTHARVTRVMRQLPAAGPLARLAGLLAILDHLAAGADDLRPLSGVPARARPAPDAQAPVARIDRVTAWMQANFARPLTVAEAAQVAHVSPGAFSRFFRREAGRPFTVAVNDLRCAAAYVRLLQSNDAVASVARTCGFATLSHFNAQFRARHGVSPREVRLGAPPAAGPAGVRAPRASAPRR